MECDEEHSAMEHRRNNFQVFQHLCCVFVFKSSEKLPIVGSLSWWQPDNMINGNGNSSTGNCSKFMLWLCSLLLLLLLLIEGRKRDFNSFVQQLMDGETKILTHLLLFFCLCSKWDMIACIWRVFVWLIRFDSSNTKQDAWAASTMSFLYADFNMFQVSILLTDRSEYKPGNIYRRWLAFSNRKRFSTRGRRGGFFNRGLVIEKLAM